ncbi:MAG: HAMP domain-containing protein [Paludibaculum sp.]
MGDVVPQRDRFRLRWRRCWRRRGRCAGGNLSYRVKVEATDELASLVRAFNEMTQSLHTNQDELERRRRFIEAVLQSIPTGVFSLTHDGTVRLVNGGAVCGFFRTAGYSLDAS